MNWSCLRRPHFCVDRNGGKSDQKGRGISISLSPLETPLLKTTRGRVCDPCLWTPSPLGGNCFLSFGHQAGKQSVRCGLQSKCCTSLARRPEGGDARRSCFFCALDIASRNRRAGIPKAQPLVDSLPTFCSTTESRPPEAQSGYFLWCYKIWTH